MREQIDRIVSLITAIEHPERLYIDFSSTFIPPEFMAVVSYSYLLSLAFETPKFVDATLAQVFALSDSYNPIISEYVRGYIHESAFDSMKSTLHEEKIPKQALVHLVREQCEQSTISTPESIIELAFAMLDIRPGEAVGEIGSGLGGFAITASGHFPEARFTGFEISSGALLVSLMRHYIERTDYRENLEFIQTDAFDIAKESGGTRFDKVFSNYPLSMRFQFSGIGKSYYESLQDRLVQPSFSHSGDWVFNMLIWDLMEASPTSKGLGIMTGGSSWNLTSKVMRQHFIDHGMIESIVALPSRLFGPENIPVMLILLSHNNTHVRMVDATSFFHAGRRQNTLGREHIAQIVSLTSSDSQNSRLVSYSEIEQEDYTLDPGRYLQQV
jgi:type I restriction-modification system DNA methylase subunit